MNNKFVPLNERAKYHTLSIQVSDKVYRRLKQLCAENNVSIRKYAHEWIIDGIDKEYNNSKIALRLRNQRIQKLREEFDECV